MFYKILIVMFCLFLWVTVAFSQNYAKTKKERETNYSTYMNKIKSLIPGGWTPGDLVEAKLKNLGGQVGDYLILLVFKGSNGKILVIQKLDNEFRKKWESQDDIYAVDGVIGDLGEMRYPADINKDGLDEISVTFAVSPIPSQGLVHLWIYTWDGAQGILISPKAEGSLKGLSLFTGSQQQPPALMDVDRDGILEVLAQDKKIYKYDSSTKTYFYWKDEQLKD